MTVEYQRIRISALRTLISMLTVLGVVGCQPDQGRPVTLIGDRAVVTFERPLCRGDIEMIEETLDHIEDSLDVEVVSPIEIALWSHYADVVAHCSEGPAGCYINGEVHSLWDVQEHEIVHAVAAPLGTPEPLWAEGIAEAISGRTRQGQADVGSLVGLQSYREVDYGTAGHFVRWLLEDYGVEGIRALQREIAFEEVYAMELADAAADYEANAPWSYPHWNPCRGEPLPSTSGDGWEHDIDVACADPWGSAQYQSGPTVFRAVEIEASGTYSLRVTGANRVGAIACQLETLRDRPVDEMAGDIIRESSDLALPTFFVGDELYEIRLEPGHLQFSITVDGEASTVGFELRRLGA